jgi:hypothetical protein
MSDRITRAAADHKPETSKTRLALPRSRTRGQQRS